MTARTTIAVLGLAIGVGLVSWWASARTGESVAAPDLGARAGAAAERDRLPLEPAGAPAGEAPRPTLEVTEGRRTPARDLAARAADHAGRAVRVYLFSPAGGSFWNDPGAAELPARVVLDVVATLQPPGERVAPDLWRRDLGRFERVDREGTRTSDPLLGTLVLDLDRSLQVSVCLGTAVLATRALESGTSSLDFVIDPRALPELLATLRFRLLDPSGAPTREASVRLSFHPGSDETITTSEIPPGGVLRFEGLKPGSCQLSVAGNEDSDLDRRVTLTPGLVDLGDLWLERTFFLKGLVVDARGNPVRDEGGLPRRDVIVECAWLDLETDTFAVDDCRRLGVGAQGEFGIPLEAGEYLLRARGVSWTSPNRVVVVPCEPVELTVLPPTPVLLRLDEGDWDGWRFDVLDDHALPAAKGALGGSAPISLGLPPGSYRLRLTDAEGVQGDEIPFDLASETVVIGLRL